MFKAISEDSWILKIDFRIAPSARTSGAANRRRTSLKIQQMPASPMAASEDFTEAELDATVLRQVRDALCRIEEGVYGRCLVDGGPIETKRLDAVPWAPYCIKHQRLMEAASRPKQTL